MSDLEQRQSTKAALICLFTAAIVAVLPASVISPLRDLTRLAFVPALRLVGEFRGESEMYLEAFSSHEAIRLRKENRQLTDRLRAVELQQRRTQLEVMAAQKQIAELNRIGPSPFAASQASPLVTSHAVEAGVIGDEIVSLWRSRRLLDRGSKSGLFEDQWVLDAKGPRIDHGQTSDVVDGLPVFAGRCIVGRIASAGRWTSSLQLVSDSEFRARAVVLQQKSDVFSGEFLLEGAGDGTCRLISVPSSQLIEMGAFIYSVSGDRSIDVPMLFGRVTSANLPPGSLHWNITVTPEVAVTDLSSVQVVTTTLNSDRMVGRRDETALQAARSRQEATIHR